MCQSRYLERERRRISIMNCLGFAGLMVVVYLLGGWLAVAFVYGGWIFIWILQHWTAELVLLAAAFIVGGWRLALIVIGGHLGAWWQYHSEQERLRLWRLR